MNLFYKNNGAVTVFLTIIMIPVLIFAGIAIDFTRVNAASAILADATSLTLNTGLASYDQVLKDVYGLLAMSSTEEELSNNLIDYFDNTINALHLNDNEEDSYTQSIINDIKNMISNPAEFNYSNLVDMTTEKFSAKGVEGSQLYNPEATKRQIVEYMKYRAPVSIANNLLQKINFFSEVPKQQDVVEAKTDYESGLSVAQKACEDTYLAIKKYDEAVANLGGYTADDFIEDAKNGVGSMWGLEDINKLVVGIYNNAYFDSVDNSGEDLEAYCKDAEYSVIKSYLVSNAFNMKVLVGEPIPLNTSKADEIVAYFISIESNYTSIEAINTYYNALYKAYKKYAKELDDAFKNEEKRREKEAKDKKIPFVPNVNTELIQAQSDYEQLCDELEAPMEAITQYISCMTNRDSIIEGLINTKAYDLDEYLLNKYKLVENVCLSLDDVNSHLYNLIDNIIPNLEKDAKVWKDKIDALSDGDIKTSMQSQYNDIAKSLRIDDVKAFMNIIDNNIVYYNYMCTDLEKVLYCGVSMCGSKAIDDLNKKIKGKVTQISAVTDYDAINESNSAFSTYFTIPDLSNIKNYDFKKYNDIEFYKFLVRICKDKVEAGTNKEVNSEAKEEAKEEKNTLMTRISEETNKYKEASKVKAIIGEIPTSGDIYDDLASTLVQNPPNPEKNNAQEQGVANINSDDNKEFVEDQNKTMEGSMSLIAKLGEYASDKAEGVRDNIYIAEYMTEMFSCYTTNRGEDKSEKTLTGVEFSADNNYLYGSELEYILWGLKGDKTNLNTLCTAGSIFGLRFVLNTIYAYTDMEIRTWTFSLAVTLAGWTGFGIPLVQNVLIIALALGETACDLVRLLNGEDVIIYKTSSTWLLKPSSITKEVTSEVAKSLTEEALDALSKKIIEVAEEKADAAAGALEASFEEYANKLRDDITSSISGLILMPIQAQIDVMISGYEYDINNLENILGDSYKQLALEIDKDDNEFTKTIKKAVLELFLKDKLNEIISTIRTKYASIKSDASGFTTAMEDMIKEKASEVIGYIIEEMDDKYEELKDLAKEKLKKIEGNVKEKANEAIDEFYNKVSSGGGTVVNSDGSTSNKKLNAFAMMNYKEYIKLFILSGMIIDTNSYITRVCDLIKLNITCSKKASNKDFKLANAYTMLQIDAEVSVRTTFMDNDYIPQPNRCRAYKLNYCGRYGY